MKELWVGKTQNTLHQFVRYIFVGGIAAVVDTGCLYILYYEFGLNHLIAAAVGFVIGLLVNYLISIVWVFETTGNFKQEFTLFAMIGVGGLLWTELTLWLSVNLGHLPVMGAKVLALCLVLIWNFGMRKKFVFASEISSTHFV
jgi:putative flippase GtrA